MVLSSGVGHEGSSGVGLSSGIGRGWRSFRPGLDFHPILARGWKSFRQGLDAAAEARWSGVGGASLGSVSKVTPVILHGVASPESRVG